MATLDDISDIKDVYNKYIVRPAGLFGFGGFVFDIEGESSITLSNDITDHFTENNDTINDHIAVRPKRVTLKNYIGELTDLVSEDSFEQNIQRVTQKLITLGAYLPDVTDSTEQQLPSIKSIVNGGSGISDLDVSEFADSSSLESVANIYALTKNFAPPTTRQQQAYLYLQAVRDQKILLSIQTPFEFMTNMAVETIVARQGEESNQISDFTVTFKEIRFAQTQITVLSEQGKAATQSQSPDNRGNIAGKEVPNSALYDLIFKRQG